MKRVKIILAVIIASVLAVLLCACFSEGDNGDSSPAPELTLGNLPDYSDAHAEDAPYIVFSSDLEPISSERFDIVRQVLYNMLHQSEVDIQYELLKDSELDEDAVFQKFFSRRDSLNRYVRQFL